MIRLTFGCGHSSTIDEKATSASCPICGNRHVMRVFARPPQFIGACSGPYAESKAVEPGIVNVAAKGPLRLKDQE